MDRQGGGWRDSNSDSGGGRVVEAGVIVGRIVI